MNLIEIQEQLKGLPDEALAKEMKSPSGLMPPFMVMSEMTRRQKTRESFTAGQNIPKTTVAEEMANTFASPGGKAPQQQIGLPQMPKMDFAPPTPQKFAEGGLVRMLEKFSAGRDRLESGGDYGARNKMGSGAFGRYQFMPSTWNDLAERYPELGLDKVTKGGPIPSKEAQDKAYEVFRREDEEALAKKGIPANEVNMYLAHKYGRNAVDNILSADPSTPLPQLMRQIYGKQAKAVVAQNRLQGKTVADELANISAKMGSSQPSSAPQSPQMPAGGLFELMAMLRPEEAKASVRPSGPPVSEMGNLAPGGSSFPVDAPPGDAGGMERLMRVLMASRPQASQAPLRPYSPQLLQGTQAAIAGFSDGGIVVRNGIQYEKLPDGSYRRVNPGYDPDKPITKDTLPVGGPDSYMPRMEEVDAPKPPSPPGMSVWERLRQGPRFSSGFGEEEAPAPKVTVPPGGGGLRDILSATGAAVPGILDKAMGAASGFGRGLVNVVTNKGEEAAQAEKEAAEQASSSSLEAIFRQMSELNPDQFGGLSSEREDLKAEMRKQREMAANMALAQAGFAIASGTSPFFAENLGKGALAGLDAYQSAIANNTKSQQALLGQGMEIEAQRAGNRRTNLGAAAQVYIGKMDAAVNQFKAQITAATKQAGGDLDGKIAEQMLKTLDGLTMEWYKQNAMILGGMSPEEAQKKMAEDLAMIKKQVVTQYRVRQ